MAWALKLPLADEVIESGLVQDFDASLSGIGQELGAGAYSMRYSSSFCSKIYALILKKQSTVSFSENYCLIYDNPSDVEKVQSSESLKHLYLYHYTHKRQMQHHSMPKFFFQSHYESFMLLFLSLLPTLYSDVLALPIFKQEESNLPPDNDNKILPFQYVLCAATSPAVKLHDETLTYLNQGLFLLNYCIRGKCFLQQRDMAWYRSAIITTPRNHYSWRMFILQQKQIMDMTQKYLFNSILAL